MWEEMFYAWPHGLDEKDLKCWYYLGPFQLGQFIRDDKIDIDYGLKFKKKSESGFKYEGQINE